MLSNSYSCEYGKTRYNEIMYKILDAKSKDNLTWHYLNFPDADELKKVAEVCKLNTSILYELSKPSLKPRAQRIGDFLYLVFHFPFHTHKDFDTSSEYEIDFVIGKDFLLTATYDKISVLDEFASAFDVHSISSNGVDDRPFEDPLDIFNSILKLMYEEVERQIDIVKNELEHIEHAIFEGHHKEMVKAISQVARDILNLKQSLDPHQDIWKSILNEARELELTNIKRRLQTTEDIFWKVRKHITNLWQTLTELRETNNSLLSTNQNEVMQILTILAFVTFPLSLIASLFGMNTEYTPLLGIKYDFWVIIALMSLATVGMFFYFKHKNWL